MSRQLEHPVTSRSVEEFLRGIDYTQHATQSAVLRYRNLLRFAHDPADESRFRDLLSQTSIREGLRIFPLFESGGVDVDVLDQTSLMHTRTVKSLDGCVTSAHCLLNGYQRVVFESGGNTGTALTVYGTRLGLHTHLFLPSDNLPLLDSGTFASDRAHLVAVDDARQVKAVAGAFAAAHRLPHVPKLDWRYQSSMLTGCFLLEHLLQHPPYDYIVQAVSAAFGPIGIYRVLVQHREALGRLPRFFGVQQEHNSPLVRSWKEGTGQTAAEVEIRSTVDLLIKVMYDTQPESYGTLEEFSRLLAATRDELTTVSRADFHAAMRQTPQGQSVIDHLARHGVEIAQRNGEVLEKAGMMALAGALREISTGRIPSGSRVLICLTGGSAHPDGRVVPERRVVVSEAAGSP
jgi:threonine synthase